MQARRAAPRALTSDGRRLCPWGSLLSPHVRWLACADSGEITSRPVFCSGRASGSGELVARVRAELPHLAAPSQREELLAAAWLMSFRAARTRRAYAGDLPAWLAWLAERGIDVLAAGRVHADIWVAGQLEDGAEASCLRRRLSALSSFYHYCAAHDLVTRIPTAGVAQPVVDPAAAGPREPSSTLPRGGRLEEPFGHAGKAFITRGAPTLAARDYALLGPFRRGYFFCTSRPGYWFWAKMSVPRLVS